MGAPNVVRGGSHSGNVSALDLVREGLLDILSSDYVPASPLQAAFSLVAHGEVSLPEASRLLSANAAQAIGLDERSEIAIGKRADVVRVHGHEPAATNGATPTPVPIVRGVWRTGTGVA